jgi:thiol-disulfide isomerase/thioredoxin
VYAPWCGHCKALEPMYAKLAQRFSSVDSIVIAKMDGSDNEHPDAESEGFPSLFFFPAGVSTPPLLPALLQSACHLSRCPSKPLSVLVIAPAPHMHEVDRCN